MANNNGRFEYTIGFKTDESGLKKAKEELEKIQQLTINSSELKIDLKPGEAEIYAANIQNAKDSALQLYNALQNATKANGQFSATSFIGQLKTLNLKEIYSNMAKLGPVGTQAFRSMADQALKLNTYVKQGNAFLTKFGNTLYRNLEWLISGNLINSVTSVFTQAYGFTKNLDSSLNNIRIVTGKSADEMERFGREAQKTALELSQGTTDITNASLIFYQQGLDQEEVNARTEVTAKMANVTGQSAETIANQMTAVWNGFKAGSEELEHYADVMTAIAASTASSSAELAGAISKVASVANLTGVDMEQLSTMISTVISVTRDSPETVGTAFKTIFARINDLVEDGTDEFGVSLGRVSSHLDAMGIHILDEEGNLRDLGDTLTEIGNKWQTYSQEQQVAIAQQIGGKRQWTQVTALFDNWDKYSSALNIAKDATGALQKQQDIYSESVAAHLQQLKTQWEGIYQELLNSKEIIAVVDIGKSLLSVFESIVKTAGGAVPILGSVASIMLGAFSDKVAQQIIRIKNNLILMAEAASDAALKTKVAEEFSRAISADDTAMRAQIAYYKAAGQMTATMTKEERERINALGELSAKKETEVEELVKEKAALDEIAKKWTNIKEYQNTSSLNLEELKEKIQQIKKEAQETEQVFKNWSPEGEGVTETLENKKYAPQLKTTQDNSSLTQTSKKDILQKGISEEEKKIWTEAENAAKEYQKALEQLRQAETTNAENIGTFQEQFRTALETAKEKMEALSKTEAYQNGYFSNRAEGNVKRVIAAAEKISDVFGPFDALKEKFEELQRDGLLSAKSIEEIEKKLKTMDRTSTDDLADAWKLLNQKLKESEKDFSRLSNGALNQTVEKLKQARTELIKQSQQKIQLLDEAQFSKATQGLTQMVSAVGQLGFGLQSLSNAWKTLNNDEATGLEKFTAMTMAIGQLSSGVKTALTGLDKFASAVLLDGKAIATVVAEENRNLIASEANQMAKKAEEEQSKRNAVAATEEAASKKANTTETNAETLSEELNTGAKAAEETTRKLNVWTIDEETGAIVVKNEVSLVERTGNALTLTSIKAMIAARLAHIATLIKEIALMAAAHWPILILIAALGALAFGISKVIKANKEAEEAHKKTQETFDKHTESVKSLANAYDELEKKSAQLLQSFKEYHNIYDAFQEGKVSVEDYISALDDLIEKLDLTEEEAEELADLLRKAKITGDYSEVNDFIEEKEEDTEENLKTSRSGKYTTLKSSTAIDIVKQENKMDSNVLNSVQASGSLSADEHRERIVGKASRWAGEGLKDAISEEGIDFSKVTAEDLGDIEDLLTEEKQQELQDLIDNSKGAEKAYYLQLYDAIYTGRMEAINQAAADSETFSNALDNNLLKFDSSTSEAVIQKNMQEYVDQVKDNIKKANPTLSDKEIDELAWEQAVDDALLISPDAEESITNIELFSEQTSQALTKAYGKYASTWLDEGKKVYAGVLFDEEEFANEMSQENMAKVNDQLKNVGLNLNQLGDFSDLSEDSIQNLMNSIMSGAPLSADAIEQISDEVNEADQAIAFANLDFDDLSQKGEEWYTKLKGNKVSPSDLVDNKGYNELLDQVEALGEAFDSEELNEAIDIISHPDAHDVDELTSAWEVANKYITEGDLKAPVLELDKALKDLKKNDVYKDGRHLVMTAELDVDEAEKKLDKFLDADRSIEVTIDTKMDEAAEKIKTDISDAADLAGKIGEGFTASLDDLDELSAAFPGVLDGMTVLADGSIQLSQQAVDAAAAQAQQEVNNEIDKQILKYKIQNDLLQYKRDKYDEALKAAAKMQQTEYDNEEALDNDLTNLMGIMDDIKDADRAATLVAEDKLTTAQLSEWEEYYTNLSLYDKQATKDRIANINAQADADIQSFDAEEVKKRFVTRTANYVYNDASGGRVEIDGYTSKIDNAGVHDYAAKVIESIKARQAEIDKQMADNLNNIKILEAYKTSNANMWKNVGKVTDATKDNTDATEENAEAQAELIELLILEADIYHDINREINNLNRAMSRLQDQQDKLTGKALADNLQEQIDLLDKQVDAKERWLKTASTDLATKSLALQDYGVEFDENGEISNYKEMYDEANDIYQAKVDWYNSLSKEEQEEAQAELDAAEARKDALEGYIKDYEDVKDSIDDAVDDIQSYLDQKIEKQVSKWKIEFEVDFSEAERKRSKLEFQKYMAGIAEDDILGNATFSVQTLATYLGEHGDMAAASRQYQELLEMKRRFDAGDMTTIYGDNGAKLQEDLDAAGDKWMGISKTVKDIEDTIKNSLLDLYDKAAEKLEEQRNSYKAISDLLEHDISLIKLRFGEQSYGKISKLLQQQRDLTEKQLQSAIAERDYFYQQLQKALESDPEMKEEATKKLAEHYKTALATVGSFAEEMANILYTNFENTVNDLFASMMEKLSGEYNLDYMKKEWDNIKAGADDYYDTVNAAYEIEKYQLQLKKAISETNDTATQKKLTDLMNNQVKLMQNKDKLSKYDVERANALFDIEQKRAAWQEAQNNKSKMRLRRDSNGNYSYQFVSDENKTADSLQALADAQNSLYNLDKDAIRTNTEEIYSLYTEMYAAIEEDAKSGGEHIEEIRDYYFQRIDQKVQDHELLRQNYQSTTFEELSKLTGTAIDDYEQLTDIEKEALMLEQDPLWGTALMKSMSSSEAFMGTLESTTAQAISAAREYIAAFDKTIDDIGTNWQEMAEGSQPMVDMLDNLTLSTDTLVESLNEATQKLAECILLLGDSPASLSEAMNIFGTDFSKLMETMTQSAVVFDNVSKSAEGAASAAAIVAKQQNESGGQSGGQAKANNGGQNANSVYLNSELEKAHTKMKEAESKAFGENEMPKVGDKVKYLGGFYYGDSYGGGRVGNRGPGGEVTVYAVEKDKPYPISVISDDSAFGWLRKDQIAKFDKGGYTGKWGPEGKVAILHEKEMVLNQDMMETIQHYNQAIQEKIKAGAESTREKLVEKINRIQDYQNQLEIISILGRFKDTLEQIASEPKNMNVDAHFPNVSTAGEIEKAFKNLTNITTQNTYTFWR